MAAYLRRPNSENTTILIAKIIRAMDAFSAPIACLVIAGDLNMGIDKSHARNIWSAQRRRVPPALCY